MIDTDFIYDTNEESSFDPDSSIRIDELVDYPNVPNILLSWYDDKAKKHGTKWPVKAAQNVFGDQLRTMNLSCRNWIWTFSVKTVNGKRAAVYLFVSKEGWSWEFNKNSDKETTYYLWLRLLSRVTGNQYD